MGIAFLIRPHPSEPRFCIEPCIACAKSTEVRVVAPCLSVLCKCFHSWSITMVVMHDAGSKAQPRLVFVAFCTVFIGGRATFRFSNGAHKTFCSYCESLCCHCLCRDFQLIVATLDTHCVFSA